MKHIVLLMLAAMLTFGAKAQDPQATADKGIQFTHITTLEEGQTAAKKQGKLMFVDVWATWCGPCVRLGKEIFTQEAVGDFFNKNFVNCKLRIDPTDEAAKAKAEQICNKYKVSAIPAMFWFNDKGEVVHSAVGMLPADRLIAEANKALELSKQSKKK